MLLPPILQHRFRSADWRRTAFYCRTKVDYSLVIFSAGLQLRLLQTLYGFHTSSGQLPWLSLRATIQKILYLGFRRAPLSLYSDAPSRFLGAASVINLDRLRAIRRRQDSPAKSPATLSADESPQRRGRSPGWLSKMHRNRSKSKRSRSPSVVPEDSCTLPQTDGSCFGRPAAAAAQEPEPEPEAPKPPELPSFLRLTDARKCFT